MEFTGNLINITTDWNTGKMQVTFSIDQTSVVNDLQKMKDSKLTIKALLSRKKRSLDANAMMWACLKDIADALNTDKWDVYLQMLKRYGKFTYIVVKEKAVEAVKEQWRECEVVGNIEINGQPAVQMLCYFGSSTYDTKEFSVLLNGIISEMREMGLHPPANEEMKKALDRWEKERNKKK